MGQTSSSAVITTSEDLRLQQRKQAAQFSRIRSAATITYKEVKRCIEELNAVTSGFTDSAGSHLKFVIKKGTDITFLWKATIRIHCLKLSSNSNVTESSRMLTLRQFVKLHKEITVQVSALSRRYEDILASHNSQRGSQGETFTASAFVPLPKKNKRSFKGKGKECCVCMDRRACIMLSCCHEFCEICIDNWTRDEEHSNCPLCRTLVSGADDTWVMTDKSDTGDYAREVKGYLMGLAAKAGNPCS